MIRMLMVLYALCAVSCPMLAQCQWGGPNPAAPLEVVANAIGQNGAGGAAFTLTAFCPGEPNAHIRIKLDTTRTIDSGLIVSPSSGTTPLEIQVGVDLSRIGESYPRQGPASLFFTSVDLTPPLTPTVLLRVTLREPDPPEVRSVVNAASLAPVVTPGAVVLIRGISLGPEMAATLGQSGLYPTKLGNTSVTFNGIPAPLVSSSPLAVRAVAPYGLAGQTNAEVVVTHYPQSPFEQVSAAFSVPVAETSPGIFSRTQSGDCYNQIKNCDSNGCTPNTAENPAPAGSIVSLWATGMPPSWAGPRLDGAVAILPRLDTLPTLTIGGQPATLRYAGPAPYQVWGVFQVNVVVPQGLAPGPQPVVITFGQSGSSSQPATLFVE